MTDATFEKLDEQAAVGPEAILVCGYDEGVAARLGEVLGAIGRPGHRVVRCSPGMVKMTLREALEGGAEDAPAPPDALPRAIVLSGLTGSEIQGFLGAFDEAGIPRAIFASATPTSLGFVVRDLLRELLAEDRAMRQRSRR